MVWDEINGNLITYAKAGDYDLITHGCNCLKNFGAGIALDFKKKFPMSFVVDQNSPSTMGTISVCDEYDECIIVNSYTQYYLGRNMYGKDSDFNRYQAIEKCMKEINTQFKDMHIALPLIGCGKAGLKWSKVKKILKKELKDMKKVTIVHYVK